MVTVTVTPGENGCDIVSGNSAILGCTFVDEYATDWPADGSVTIQFDIDSDPGNGMHGEWTGIPVRPDWMAWLDVPQDAGFDLDAGHLVRMIDEAQDSFLPIKETQVNPLTLVEPVVAGVSTIAGTGNESAEDLS